MQDREKRIKAATSRGDVKKLVEVLRRSRGKGLVYRQLYNRGIHDVPAAYYGALEQGFPVYTEQERDADRGTTIRFLLGAE